MVCGAPIFSAAVRLAPPAGSTSVTFVSALVASSHEIMPADRPPPPTGSTRRSGARPSSSTISTATEACPSITSGSSKGDRKCAPVSAHSDLAAASVWSKKSPVSTISMASPPKVLVFRIFCSGVVTGM
jgi:hypothetical protein